MGAADLRVAEAIAAAERVGAEAGFDVRHCEVLGQTNNVVMRLHPEPVVAKVGTWSHSPEVLGREHVVARALVARNAPAAAPVAGTGVAIDDATGHVVTLWDWLETDDAADDGPAALARSLRQLHAALDEIDDADGGDAVASVPDFRWALDLAGETLVDDSRMTPMIEDDLAFLRRTFSRLRRSVDDEDLGPDRLLHGEPHRNNVVVTVDGPRWIDFEAACRGPLAYDLASVAPDVVMAYGALEPDDSLDMEVTTLLRLANSARVAVWCWAGAADPAMRSAAQVHLRVLRDAFPGR